MYIYIYTYMYIYIYVCIHIYTYTYTHTETLLTFPDETKSNSAQSSLCSFDIGVPVRQKRRGQAIAEAACGRGG